MKNLTKLSIIMSAILIVGLSAAHSFAYSYTLTGNGLGLNQGNYGSSLDILPLPASPDLTLHAITRIGQSGYNSGLGIDGNVFVHSNDGIGVKGEDGGGSKEISGAGKHEDEALFFDFATPVNPQTIVLGLNKFKAGETLFISLFDPHGTIPNSSIQTHFTWFPNDDDTGYLDFSKLSEIGGISSLSGFSVQALDGHFYVNSIEASPVPIPGAVWLFGSGLIGLFGYRKRAKK